MPSFGTFARAATMQDWRLVPNPERPMKHAMIFSALLLSAGATQAQASDGGRHMGCDVGSQYAVKPYRGAFLFTRDADRPMELGIGGGRLFIDGREAQLSAGDHRRLLQFEAEGKRVLPQIEQITVEAVDIAFTALTEVARALASDPRATVTSLESAHRRVRAEMGSRPLMVFNDDAMADVVKPLVTEYVPEIVGGAVSTALKAAFSGDKARADFEARMQRMEHELDTRVEARAKALEPLAQDMCERMRRMDSLDNALEFRLPDGQPLQLLKLDRRDDRDAP
jgi:hypothetical protein